MKNNYIISIDGKQLIDGHIEKVQLLIPCEYEHKDGQTLIRYSEFDESRGNLETKSTVRVEKNNMVLLTRENPKNSKLTLETGKRHVCHYNTEFGDINVGVFATKIEYDLNKDGGSINLSYTLDIGTSHLSENKVVMMIKKGAPKDV